MEQPRRGPSRWRTESVGINHRRGPSRWDQSSMTHAFPTKKNMRQPQQGTVVAVVLPERRETFDSNRDEMPPATDAHSDKLTPIPEIPATDTTTFLPNCGTEIISKQKMRKSWLIPAGLSSGRRKTNPIRRTE